MFRKSEEKDCKAIYDLICDMENKELPYVVFEEIYRKQLQKEDMYCLIREENGKVTAMLNLRFEEQLHHSEKIAEIMEFVVDAEYRNAGAGKEVLAEAGRVALEHGCSQIEVACNQLRKDTHRFYEREGMHNFHYKFSKRLTGEDSGDNVLGR
ncbi:MAG: GNAT family N-acetyltransferase [Anaerotignum sp.]|nr:GNAT family N-acetyltransferase [Anaerotignum sp.]